jgi:diaminopimelate epimerase
MELHNADGSRAEMSGNGICCAGQAALLAGVVDGPTFSIDSDVGVKTITLCAQPAPDRHTFRVDLGTIDLGGVATEWLGDGMAQAEWVSAGNPHLVVGVAAHDAIDLVALGRRVNEAVPGGANVETVVVDAGTGELTMRVYERGVGITEACGTGACASAAAAHSWGLVGNRVVVHQPGGTATIDLGPTVHYTVDVAAVARIDWPWA